MLSNNRDIYAFSIAASILISIWSVFADPVINQDGVHYLLAAGDFTRGDFAAGLSLFKWPAYALLIALISKVTPLGVEASAHLLNALFFASLVGAFLVTVRQLGGTRTTLICAALVLLLFPSLNKFRPFIIRDAGYLSFYMWSLVFLLQHAQTRDSKSLIFGLALLGVAGLFRVEAFALAAMIPLMLFGIRAQSTWHKRAYWLAGATLTGVVSIGLVLWVFGAESLVPLAAFKAHPIDSTLEIFRLVFQQIGFRLDAIRYEFLTEFSGDFAALVFGGNVDQHGDLRNPAAACLPICISRLACVVQEACIPRPGRSLLLAITIAGASGASVRIHSRQDVYRKPVHHGAGFDHYDRGAIQP